MADIQSATAEIRRGKCSAVAEMGDRLATLDMGRKLGLFPFGEGQVSPHLTQCFHG